MEGVDLAPFVVLVLGMGVRGLMRNGHPARPEGDPQVRVLGDGADTWWGQVGLGVGPGQLPVELHFVGVLGAGLEVVDADERVVVAVDAEGRLGEAKDLDLTGLVCFDPDGRLGLVRVAEHRSHDHFGHELGLPETEEDNSQACGWHSRVSPQRWVRKPRQGSRMGTTRSRTRKSVNRELIELINELRVALVGVQVLFAFLLAVPFAQGFADVTNLQKALFFVVLCSTAIASALLVAPSAYHRINFRAKDKEQMLRTSNGLMIGGLVFVAVSIVGAVVLIADFIYDSTATTIACAVVGAALFVGLWFILPLVRRDPEQTPD